MRRLKPLIFGFCFSVLFVVSSASGEGLATLERTDNGFRFSGATPFGEVAGVVAWVESQGLLSFVHVERAALRDEVGEGVVTWSKGARLPEEAFCVMGDVTSGKVGFLGLGGNAGSFGLEVSEDGRLLMFSGLGVTPSYLVVVVVRSGVGVWTVISPDGSKFDRDGREDAAQALGVDDFVLVAGTGALTRVMPGDRIVAFDLRSAVGFETELGGR